MKRYFLACSIITTHCLMSFSQQTRVLFLGNSYTYVNDLPGTLSQLALSLGDSIYYDSHTVGGYMLIQHTTDSISLAKIATAGWDYVVLQAQSEEPALDSNAFYYQTYPYAHKLDSLIHLTNPCAITLFYMTWGRKYGDSYWCPVNPPMCTFNGMNTALRERYLIMAHDNYSRVAPAGVAWRNAWQADSSINLWSGDNSHPSIAGTYLTANVFYASIFKQPTSGASYSAGLSGAQASFLQNTASQTVLDSLNTWMLNQNPIHADFSDTIQLSQVQFYPNCYNANQFWWDFGDGVGYSSLGNSGYYYNTTGTYLVELIASNQCYSDTIYSNISIANIGIDNYNEPSDLKIYPTPASNALYIEGSNWFGQPYYLQDLNGKMVLNGILNSSVIDITECASGLFFLRIGNETKKVLIKH